MENQGSITFNGVTISDIGDVTFTLSREPEKSEKPSRTIHTISMVVSLHSHTPSTQRAKLLAIQAALNTHEAELVISDENSIAMTHLARPSGDTLNEALQHGRNTVNISFTTWSKIGTGYTGDVATYTPTGLAALTLRNVSGFTQNISTARSDQRAKNRQLTTSSITFNARTAYADNTASQSDRLIYLQAQKALLENLYDKPEGVLVWSNINETIQTESIAFSIDDSCDYLNVSFQGRYSKLPDSSTAEADYTIVTSEPCAEGTITTTISGNIQAEDRAIAITKLDALITTHNTVARRLEKKDVTDSYLDGYDGNQWTGLNFTIEFKEGNPTEAGFTLTIDDSESSSGHKTTYSGTSKAASLAVALAKARELGDLQHPVQDSCTETVNYIKDCGAPETPAFVEVTFSYTYTTAAIRYRGTLSSQTTKPAFSDYITTLSGSISAPTQALAETQARSYIPGGTFLRTNEETVEKNTFQNTDPVTAEDQQFTTLNFTYSYHTAHTTTTVQQKMSQQNDTSSMTATLSLSGSIYAIDKATAEARYELLKPVGVNLLTDTFGHDSEDAGSGSAAFLKFDFSMTWKEKLTGLVGTDILEASFRLERRGQIEHRPITEIPCGTPIVQDAFGTTTGSLTASGTVKARVQATARAWGQAKRTQAATQGAATGIPQQPTESSATEYLPASASIASDILTYTFSFSYPFTYVSGLDNLWPASLTIT